ncbi:MAG: magnesium/cobalt transporter CorA [Spirochaetota bacterium]
MKKTKRMRSYQPGLAPGTIRGITAEDTAELEISILDYRADQLAIREHVGIADVAKSTEASNRWIRMRGTPTTGLLERLGSEFGAHNLILEDIISAGQRIKVEDYDNLKFIVLRTLSDSAGGEYEESELSMILTPTTIVTVFETNDPSSFSPIVSRLQNPDSLLRHHGVDFLFHAVVDLVVDRFFPIIEQLEERATDLEAQILQEASEEHLRAIHQLRSNSQQVRRVLWATRDVISRIERSANRFIVPETLFYFRDIHDHVVHLLDAVSTLRDTANGLMELYMSRISNRMNEVMKVLTIVSTLFIPGTFIAGVYGMNFVHMPELSVPWAYPVVLAVMGAIGIGMIIFFKRRRWF